MDAVFESTPKVSFLDQFWDRVFRQDLEENVVELQQDVKIALEYAKIWKVGNMFYL